MWLTCSKIFLARGTQIDPNEASFIALLALFELLVYPRLATVAGFEVSPFE